MRGLPIWNRSLFGHPAGQTPVTHNVREFFGRLLARTAEWGVITSAPALAEAVMKLQQLLEANTRLTGVSIASSALLNNELKLLADSNVPPD
jgi:hypothetical protein